MQSKEMPVILQVDSGADASTIVRVIDEAKIAGAAVYLATDETSN